MIKLEFQKFNDIFDLDMDCINLQALGDSSQSESSCSSYSNELTNFEKLQSEDSNNFNTENSQNQERHIESVCLYFSLN